MNKHTHTHTPMHARTRTSTHVSAEELAILDDVIQAVMMTKMSLLVKPSITASNMFKQESVRKPLELSSEKQSPQVHASDR